MSFALRLQDSLRNRDSQIAREFAAGETLETVLSRHLLAVEASADTELLTSILLLDPDGKRLWHGAAPSLPRSYCEAIDGTEIGPTVGSCGSAAYLGEAVYVTDVATDPLWTDFRELALQHGLRACWSTPIRNSEGAIIGTFAVYHLTPRGPTSQEVEAIRMITAHVAQAIEWAARGNEDRVRAPHTGTPRAERAKLKLVSDNDLVASEALDDAQDEQAFSARLQEYAAELDRYAGLVNSQELSDALKAVARDCRSLVNVVRGGRFDENRS